MLELTGTTLVWVIGGLAVGLLLEMLVFWASCALGDFDIPGYLSATICVAFHYILCMGAMLYFINHYGAASTASKAPGAPVAWDYGEIAKIALMSLGANFILAIVVYGVVLAMKPERGVIVVLLEIILRVMMTALIVGLVLVVMAGIQIYQTNAGRMPTEIFVELGVR